MPPRLREPWQYCLALARAPRPSDGLVVSPLVRQKVVSHQPSLTPCPDSLLPPGEKQAVIEEVQVDRLAGQLQLGRGGGRQWCQLHQLPVPHQPAGLRDQWEDLGRWRRQGRRQVRPRAAGQRAQARDGKGQELPFVCPSRWLWACTLPSKWIFLLRWMSSSVLFMDCTLALHSCTSWGGHRWVTCSSQTLAPRAQAQTPTWGPEALKAGAVLEMH